MKLWDYNTMNSKDYIQEVYKNGLENFRKLLLNSKTIRNNYLRKNVLTSVLVSSSYQDPFQHTITAWTLLANRDAVNFRDRFFSFRQWEKLFHRRDVHHNPIIKYASRCLEKRKWLHVLWDKSFPEIRTNREESMKT